MKKIILSLALLIYAGVMFSQTTYNTTGSGDWNEPLLWDIDVPPTADGLAHTINVKHDMTVTANWLARNSCTVNIFLGKTLTINSGRFWGSSTGTVNCYGTIINSGGLYLTTGDINIDGTYDKAVDGGTVKTGINWGVSSTLKLSGLVSSFPTLSSTDTYLNTLEIDSPGMSSNIVIQDTDIEKFSNITLTNTGGYSIETEDGQTSIIPGLFIVNTSGKLLIGPTDKLTVNGTFTTANSSCLEIQSTALGTGSLITTSSPAATMKCYVSANSWHLIGSPMATAPASTFSPGHMQRWHEYDDIEAGYWEIIETDVTLSRGHGDAFYSGSVFTGSFSGSLVGSGVTVDGLTNSTAETGLLQDGYHLLANPFPCAVRWTSDDDPTVTKSGIGASALVYNGTNYVTTSTISALQGFFVQVNVGATGSVVFTEDSKTHDNTALYKSVNNASQSFKLALTDNLGKTDDEFIVQLDESATFNYDPEFDAHKIMGSSTAGDFYGHISEDEYACVIGIPYDGEAITIPVSFKKGDASEYIINVEEMNLPDNLGLVLEDVISNQFINLKSTDRYVFNSVESTANRFNLLLSNTTGIDEDINDFQVSIWNKNEKVYIQNLSGENYAIYVYDISGKIVYSNENNVDEISYFDLNGPTGAYIVKYISDSKVLSQKIIK